ncbi:MAG: hypothetical protein ACXIU8_12295 [Alkalilacustris sp.]
MDWLGLVCLLAGLLPVILPALGLGLAWVGGCSVDIVDAIPPCHVAGLDITAFLRIVAFAPWILVLSWPLVPLGVGLLAAVGLIALLQWARRR